MTKQSWKGSALLNPVPPVLVSCGSLEKPQPHHGGLGGHRLHPAAHGVHQPAARAVQLRPHQGQRPVRPHLPTEALVRAVDWCGVKSGRDVDKFAALGLHAGPGTVHPGCPILAESPLALECRVTQTSPWAATSCFWPRWRGCLVDEDLLDDAGRLCLDRARLIAYSHGEYRALGRQLGTFGYTVKSALSAAGAKSRGASPASAGGKP